MTDYAIRHGFLAEASVGAPPVVPAWSAYSPGYLDENHYPPCLVVTGDLDAARRRLAPLDDAAIERAARAAYEWYRDEDDAVPIGWDFLTGDKQHRWRDRIIAALAAAEENTDA